MKKVLMSRREFSLSSMTGLGAAGGLSMLAAPGAGFAGSPQRGGAPEKGFLQVTQFENVSKENLHAFFQAIDQSYTPKLLKAPGLIYYQRFRHFDLPLTLDLQLWETREQSLAFYEAPGNETMWKAAVDKLPEKVRAGIPKDYLVAHHSNAHRHFILLETLKF